MTILGEPVLSDKPPIMLGENSQSSLHQTPKVSFYSICISGSLMSWQTREKHRLTLIFEDEKEPGLTPSLKQTHSHTRFI